MKWLTGFIILAQLPFLFIAFLAGGTDGKSSSLLKVWAVVIPIFLCGIYSLYRHFTAAQLTKLDWAATAVACAPVLALVFFGVRKLLTGS